MEGFFDPITGMTEGFGYRRPRAPIQSVMIAVENEKGKKAAEAVAREVPAVREERAAIAEKFKLAAKHDPTVVMQQQAARGSGKPQVRTISLDHYRAPRRRAAKK